MLLQIPRAAAVDPCSVEEQIFVRSTSDRLNTKGTQNKILFKNRELDASGCNAVAVSTAHISKNFTHDSPSGYWVEIGWRLRWLITGQVKGSYIFTEKGVDFNVTDYSIFNGPLEFGTYDFWKINGRTKPDGVTEWELSVNFLDGQGWRDPFKTYNTNWDWGVALGETERFAQDTGMRDDQKNLGYKNANGNWPDWPNVQCVQDRELNTPDVWQWSKVSSNHYEVIKNGTSC